MQRIRAALGDVAEKVKHERKQVSGLLAVMAEVRRQMEGVTIKQDELLRRVGDLEWAARGLAETRDRLNRIESVHGKEVARLRDAIAAGSPAMREELAEIRREVATLKEEVKAKQGLPGPKQPAVKQDNDICATTDGGTAHASEATAAAHSGDSRKAVASVG
jgi:chromosome segregation ATPase